LLNLVVNYCSIFDGNPCQKTSGFGERRVMDSGSKQRDHEICDGSVMNSLTLRCVYERSRPYLDAAEPVTVETSEPSTVVNVVEASGLLD
jgi:hypothetical protein